VIIGDRRAGNDPRRADSHGGKAAGASEIGSPANRRWTDAALGSGAREKTFLVCAQSRTDCVSTKTLRWRKPFIITRTGGVAPGFGIYDTGSQKHLPGPHSAWPRGMWP